MPSQWKRCPRCNQIAELHASRCICCGHAYRTQFAAANQTQAFTACADPTLAMQPDSAARYRYASCWARLVARVIDASAILPFMLLPGYLMSAAPQYQAAYSMGYRPDPTPGVFLLLWFLLLSWAYNCLSESSAWQGTLGKRMMGLIVTDNEGHPLTLTQATARHICKAATWSCSLFFFFAMVGSHYRKQALHDQLADCLVWQRRT